MEVDQNHPQLQEEAMTPAPAFDAQEEARKRRTATLQGGEPSTPPKEQEDAAPSEDPEKVKPAEKEPAKEAKEPTVDIEGLNKLYEDNKAYASDVKRRLSLVQSKITSLIDSGDIEEETGKSILEAMSSKAIKEPDDLKQKLKESQGEEPQGIFSPLYKNITPDLLNQYLEVSEDAHVSDKVHAFDALIAQATEEEQKEILERVLEKGKTPMSHLKAMLECGQQFLDEGFGEYLKAGGVKKYTTLWKEKQTELEKKIDNLQKKLREYEGNFDPPEKMNLGGSFTGVSITPRKFDGQEEARRRREAKQRITL